MIEPRRWLDDAGTSPRVRELLGAAPAVPALSAEVQALSTTLVTGLVSGLPVNVAAVSAGAKTAPLLLALGTAGKVVIFASLVGAAGAAGYLLIARPSATPPTLTDSRSLSASASPSAQQITAPTASALELPATAADSATVPRSNSAAAQAVHVGGTSRSAADREQQPEITSAQQGSVAAFGEPSIADEARLLEQARSALPSNPAQALELVERHQRLYPDGQLGLERELIAVDALVRLGRRTEAGQRAAPYLQLSPDNLYSRRLRQILGSN